MRQTMRNSNAMTERDYIDSIGAFFLLNKKGQLVALNSIMISDDLNIFTSKTLNTDLTAMYPLVERVKSSSIVLSVSCGPSQQTHYLMQLSMGGTKRSIKAPGKTTDIISKSLENDNFPVIAQTDLERALYTSRETGEALTIPVRMLVLRASVPKPLLAHIKTIFLHNASGSVGKRKILKTDYQVLRETIRETLLSDFLSKCMWLEKISGRLGNMVRDGKTFSFQTLNSDDPELTRFLIALEKDPYGDYILDFREFGRIIPTISKSTPWVGPTLHIYNESYRTEYNLEEHYSLYAGFRALTQHGAPVVLLEGQNPLIDPSEIRYLQVSHRSVNVLQGRILDGNLLTEGVRDFTTRALVWKT